MALRVVDLTDPEQGELGDTHLLPKQVAKAAGRAEATIRGHLDKGNLTKARALLSCEMHPVKHHRRLYVVAVYDAKLYEYMDAAGERTTWGKEDKREAARLSRHMPYEMVSKRTGIPVGTLGAWASEGIIPPRDHPGFTYSTRVEAARTKREARKERQRTARRLADEGYKLYMIASIMRLHEDTVRKYLNGYYDPPDE